MPSGAGAAASGVASTSAIAACNKNARLNDHLKRRKGRGETLAGAYYGPAHVCDYKYPSLAAEPRFGLSWNRVPLGTTCLHACLPQLSRALLPLHYRCPVSCHTS